MSAPHYDKAAEARADAADRLRDQREDDRMTAEWERASAPKHTPGPWFCVPYGDGHDTVICEDEAGNRRIAFMAIPGCRDQQERRKAWREIKANARLIAAAPELLEALEMADAALRGCNMDMRAVERKARAAIAKARGAA